MPLDGVYLGFDFGYKRIGMAVGQKYTGSASPLTTIQAQLGVPNWNKIDECLREWRPKALIVGIPTCIDGKEQYTTAAAREFADKLTQRYSLPVYLVDERLTTVEARSYLFSQGGYKKIKSSAIDSIAACIILEQWLQME